LGNEANNEIAMQEDAAVGAETAPTQPETEPQDDFRAAYLEQLRRQAGIVPEMIEGDSLSEIAESVKRAKEAYKRIATEVSSNQAQIPPVPAGGYQTDHYVQPELFKLDAVGKIAYGISKRSH
jgi:hypothetical protein